MATANVLQKVMKGSAKLDNLSTQELHELFTLGKELASQINSINEAVKNKVGPMVNANHGTLVAYTDESGPHGFKYEEGYARVSAPIMVDKLIKVHGWKPEKAEALKNDSKAPAPKLFKAF